MACKSCNKKKKDPTRIISSSGVVNRKTGKRTPISQPLVDSVPPGGWSYSTVIKGVPITLKGRSANDVLAKTRVAHFNNGTPLNEEDFWISANVQWLNRCDKKYHLAAAEDLLKKKGDYVEEVSSATLPGEWGSIAWKFLGLLLAKNNFDIIEFTAAMRTITDMLNPKTNPSLGCSDCHIKATGMLNDLMHHPPRDLHAARIWLVKKHNIVNARHEKEQLDMHEAAKANFWT